MAYAVMAMIYSGTNQAGLFSPLPPEFNRNEVRLQFAFAYSMK
jgi:hypothetical protein